MQPPPSPSVPIDPALALYPPYYPHYAQQQPPHHLPQHLALPSYSSPSSGGSDTLGTPPTEHMYPSSSSFTGKRPASVMSNTTSDSRKKSRKDDESESQSPRADKEELVKPKPTRGSRACTVCRRLKMKCVGAEQGGPCKRCASGGHECVFEESNRGKRSLKKHELLHRSLRKMEKTLDNVLRSIGNPSIASAMVSRTPSPEPSAQAAGTSALMASSPSPPPSQSNAFTQSQMPEGGSPKLHSLPDNSLNPLGLLAEASLANRKLQNPKMKSVCSIAAKYYTAKPDLHPRLTELAKKLAFSVPAQGYKSLEIVQAYLLLSLWGCGAVERYEQDKTWMLLGMGIRMATDLNLHRKTAITGVDTEEGRARDLEVHNRERTWILCFCLDRSFSAQMGKPHSIKEDAIIRGAGEWCYSPIAAPSDPSLCAYAELQRVLSRCLDFLYAGTDTPSGLQVHCDYMLVIKSFEAQLYKWKDEWVDRRSFSGNDNNTITYKKLIAEFYFNYARLVLNSFGLQNALKRSPVDLGHFFAECHSAATSCALLVRDHLGPKGYMKYAPDSHCVMISYALLTLFKLIRPEFHPYLDDEQRIFSLVAEVADTLENCAANPLHTPALYSHFLRAILNAKTSSSSETSDANGSDTQRMYQDNTDDSTGNPNTTTLDNVTQAQSLQNNGVIYHDVYSAEPGYTLNPFGFESEMGPVADMSTFPPTMAPNHPEATPTSLTMDHILSTGFWDSVIVPGYNSMDGLSGGFLFGAGGSGLITPRFGQSPAQSGANTPSYRRGHDLTQTSINSAFMHSQMHDSAKIVSES
ncbi:hypothetical protein H0H93_001930 [Arthromyces matolae]|nr:hypothetical protein H0H93_001930 [Arthromyces matolae]